MESRLLAIQRSECQHVVHDSIGNLANAPQRLHDRCRIPVRVDQQHTGVVSANLLINIRFFLQTRAGAMPHFPLPQSAVGKEDDISEG